MMYLRIMEKTVQSLPNSKLRAWEVLQKNLRKEPEQSACTVHIVQHHELFADEVCVLSRINQELNPRVLGRRWVLGNTCYVTEAGSVPVLYAWAFMNATTQAIKLKNHVDMHVDVWLAAGWAYIWDVWIAEAWRGQGIMLAAVTHIGNSLQARGCTGLMSLVNRNNAASRRAFHKADFCKAATVWHLRILGHDIVLGSYHPEKLE